MRDEALHAWHQLLSALGELGDALCAAITAGDVVGAIAATMEMRRVRSAIALVEAPVRLRCDREELEALSALTSSTVAARVAEAAMQRWLDRPLPGDARLLASPLGVAVLVDAMLPAVWDFETDLCVLIGPGLEPVAEILASLGQRRIVAYGGAAVAPAVLVETADEAAAAVRTMVPNPPTRFVVRAALGSDGALADELVETMTDVLGDLRIHRNTVRVFSKTWLHQGVANLPALARWPSVATVGDAFAGVPMVIVAPGPSLAYNVDQLRALRGRAIVTAFSHSLRPVLAAGVVPDLVVTVDPQDVRYHFAGCDVSQTCLVNAATVHPSLYELPAARFLTLSANCAVDDWMFAGLGEDAIVPGGGSVATSAFSLALRWKCDPIIFVGLDLSFPGGDYYVATSADGGARARVDERGVMRVEGWSSDFHAMKAGGGPTAAAERSVDLPGWHGGTVPSSFMFAMFHRWFVHRLESVDGITVYNCTEGGARIPGMDHRPLAEVIAGLDREHAVAATLDAIATDGARAEQLAEHFRGVVRMLRHSRRLARCARRMIDRGVADHRLAAIEAALMKALQPIEFAALLAQREVDRAHDIARRPGADYLAASASLLDTLIAAIDELEPAIDGALARLPAKEPPMFAQRKRPPPRIIAVAGGKGGVGKSTVAANLALAIAKLGHRVTIVDADLGAANLHTMFGVLHPETGISDFLDKRLETLDAARMPVALPTLGLVPGSSRPGAANLTRAHKLRLLRGIANLECDCVIIDIGAGTSFNVVDFVAAADIKLFVLTPQLPSLHNAYALLKACVHRVVRKLAADDVGQGLIDSALGQEKKARTIPQLMTVLQPLDAALSERIVDTLGRFGVGLVANQVESEHDVAALSRMTPLMHDHLMVHAPVMASIRRSSALGGGLRAGTRTLVDATDTATPQFRLLARTVLDLDLATLRGQARTNKPETLPLWILRDLVAEADDPPAA